MAKKKASSKGKWLNNVARLIKKKDGGYFLVFGRRTDKDGTPVGEDIFPLTINEGDIFQAKVKKDDLQRLVDDGRMDQETADDIARRVKFEFSIAPKKDEDQEEADEDEDESEDEEESDDESDDEDEDEEESEDEEEDSDDEDEDEEEEKKKASKSKAKPAAKSKSKSKKKTKSKDEVDF